jgi:hypothetical protein
MRNNVGYNSVDTELISLIKKVNKLGINVVYADQHVSAQCLTVVLDQVEDNTKEMVPVIDGTLSPFTWKLGTCEFKRWAHIATRYPYNKINELISSIVRRMEPSSFDVLRKHSRLETEFLEKLYTELQTIGFKTKLNSGVIIRLFLVYGGIFNQELYLEDIIIKLFAMVLNNKFVIDKCRSCKYCQLHPGKGVGRKCVSPANSGFVIPEDMVVGKLLNDFPDIYVKEVGDKNIALTKWIPENKKTCEHYKRRF